MNAGGVPNTCKSNEDVFVVTRVHLSGEWVSNALVTCPEERNNPGKLGLIPHVLQDVRSSCRKGLVTDSLREGPASHQLVGKVMAYQGYDG